MRKYAYGLRLLLALVLASGIFVTATPMQMEAKETQAFTTQDLNEQLVMASLWMQTSAEFRALCYQAFNLARMNLDVFLDSHKSAKPVAVIVDADETVIDNSAYEAFLIGQNFGSHFSWATITMISTVPSGINRWLTDWRNRQVQGFLGNKILRPPRPNLR